MTITSDSDEKRKHFLGAIVVVEEGLRDGDLQTFTLVDGQQRLLTTSILLCALANTIDSADSVNQRLNKSIRKYLKNDERPGSLDFKIFPTESNGDRDIWISLVNFGETDDIDKTARIYRSYLFFKNGLEEQFAERNLQPNDLFNTIVNKLEIVFINLERDEQPHQIFESLNTKGLELSEADKIRNYIAMRLPDDKQDEIWKKYWRKMEDTLKDDKWVSRRGRIGELTAFFRHYLACRTFVLSNVAGVYIAFRDYMNQHGAGDDSFEFEMATLYRYARHYEQLLHPNEATHIGKQLIRLNDFEATATYPLLLYLFDQHHQQNLTKESLHECLVILENYLVRSTLGETSITRENRRYPTMVRKFFIKELVEKELVIALRVALDDRDYPNNIRIKDVLKTLDMYRSGRRAKLKFILKEISQQLAQNRALDVHTELISEPTIEHILPQNPRDAWQWENGLESVPRDLINNIGNLTIVSQSFNSALSNRPFEGKRTELMKHGLDINHQYFVNVHQWNQKEIERRRDWLIDQIIKRWPAFPKPYIEAESVDRDEYNRKYPSRLILLDADFPSVRTWKDLAILFTEHLIKLDHFDNIGDQDLEFVRRNQPEDWLDQYCHQLSNGWWLFTGFWAYQAVQHCKQLAKFTGLSEHDWRIELR